MEPTAILIPMFTLMAFTMVMILTLGLFRNVAVLSGRVQIKVFKSFSEPGETEGLLAIRRNVANLFELPVVFYALCLTAFAAAVVDQTTVALAWAFTGSRLVHSAIHITYNNVLHRFLVFAAGLIIVAVMLIRIAASV
jgi:hypothetical protein